MSVSIALTNNANKDTECEEMATSSIDSISINDSNKKTNSSLNII